METQANTNQIKTNRRNEALQTIAKLELLHSALTGEAELAPKTGLEWSFVKQACAAVKTCSMQLQIELMKTQSRFLTAYSHLAQHPETKIAEDSVENLLDFWVKNQNNAIKFKKSSIPIEEFKNLNSSWDELRQAIRNGIKTFESQVEFLKNAFGRTTRQIDRSGLTYALAATTQSPADPNSGGWVALLSVSEPSPNSPETSSSSYSGPYLG